MGFVNYGCVCKDGLLVFIILDRHIPSSCKISTEKFCSQFDINFFIEQGGVVIQLAWDIPVIQLDTVYECILSFEIIIP